MIELSVWGLIIGVGAFILLLTYLESVGRKVRELEKRVIVLETKLEKKK